MRIGKSVFALLLSIATFQLIRAQCDLSGKADKSKDFPDLFAEADLSYQLSAEFTLPNLNQTDYYNEYYDINNKRGRVDSHIKGESTRYYYYYESLEAFEISGYDCNLKNVTDTPEFMGHFQEEWMYIEPGEPRIYGPSAVFRHALKTWKQSPEKMAYMGKSNETIRGLETQYWRRCRDDLAFDYYFTTDDHEDAYGFKKLIRIPLKMVLTGRSKSMTQELPQMVEIIAFQPFVSDMTNKLELPRGYGCVRGDLVDAPDLPDFSGKNLLLYGEAVYRGKGDDDDVWRYTTTFMLARDLATSHIAYYFTPWGAMEKKKQLPGDPQYVIYDTKNYYYYSKNLTSGMCTISRPKQFIPRYDLPNNGGYIDLTDPLVILTNNELEYLSEGTDRGLAVHLFETVAENFPLGDRIIPQAIITHYYLKDNEILRDTSSVVNALTRVRMVFLDRQAKGTKFLGSLTFNFFGFSTQITHQSYVFNIASCFINNDDYLWVTLGFPADKSSIQKIRQEVPSITANMLTDLTLRTELTPLRIPIILVDFGDLIYVTALILNKPPIMLDFLDAENNKHISGTTEAKGVMGLQGCAKACLEDEVGCWGFSICGAICYFGVDDKSAIVSKTGCDLYRRFNNDSYVPSKENVANNLRIAVEEHQMNLVVPVPGSDEKPFESEASYITVTSPGEDDEYFDLIGMEQNPRLKVQKVGMKLDKDAGQNIKNFGQLSYAECQRICLDYQQCETVSYCLSDHQCVLSTEDIDSIPSTSIKQDNFCNLLTRKHADKFERTPGNILSKTARKVLNKTSAEECARACVKEKSFDCLSFDHCQGKTDGCRLHAVHYLDSKTKESAVTPAPVCGHYSKKYSYDFKRKLQTKIVGTGFIAATNITLEECAKICKEYGKGTCYGFNFCQDKTLLGTSCTLIDTDMSTAKTTYSPICTEYTRADVDMLATPYSNATAAGVGILCFAIGGIVGAVVFFLVMYYRVNRSR